MLYDINGLVKGFASIVYNVYIYMYIYIYYVHTGVSVFIGINIYSERRI
jgi:hypothetical protein